MPEFWRFDKGKLHINLLRDRHYVETQESFIFPRLPLVEAIPEYLEQSKTAGRNATIKAFRLWVQQQIQQQ